MGTLNRKAGPRLRPWTNPAFLSQVGPAPARTVVRPFSAVVRGLALESPLRLGGVAPRTLTNGPECNCRASHKSFKPRLWLSCP